MEGKVVNMASLKLRHVGFTLAMVCVIPQTALAQDLLDWQTCVLLGTQHALRLKIAAKDFDKAQASISIANSDFFPSVAANAGTHRSIQDKTPSGTTATNDYSFGLSLRQNLYAGGRSTAEVEKSQLALEASKLNLEQIDINLGHDLRLTFDNALFYQKLIEVLDRAVDRRRQNVSIVKLRYEGGSEHKGSLLKAQASLAESEADLDETHRRLTLAKTQLAMLLGADIKSDTKFVGELRRPNNVSQPNFEQIASNLVTRRKALTDVRISETQLSVQKAAYYPEIGAEASVLRSSTEWPPDRNRFEVGITLNLTLYNGDKTPANVRSASHELAKSELALRDVESQSLFDLKQSFTGLVDTTNRLRIKEQILAASKVQAKVTRDQYTLGLTTFQTWDQIESELINNEKTVLTSLREVAQAQTEWEKAKGLKLQEITL